MHKALAYVALGLAVFGCGARSSLPRPDGADGNDGGSDPEGRVTSSVTASTGQVQPADGGGGAGEGGLDGTGGEGPVLPECDPDVLFVYLVTAQTTLLRFDPANTTFETIGALSCPTSATPFSMAVSRSGRAYSVYTSGELFRINVINASCQATDWVPRFSSFETFGMGYALDDDGLGESLYVTDYDLNGDDDSDGLARLDTTTFELQELGPFSSNPGRVAELTSADDGELYGYFLNRDTGGTLVRIDKQTAEILEETRLPPPSSPGSALAFAYWNGDFYIFTTSGAGTDVTRYRPATGEVGIIATLAETVVGAGVTTCDPDDLP
jgi:hypothetical protein